MRALKDSGIEWLGKIPSEWEVRKVKNYYDIQTGFTPDTKNELYYDDDNGYDWINISDIEDGKTIFETKKKVSKHYIDLFKPKVIPQGSLLYSFKLSVGQTAYAGKDIYSNEAIASFIPNEFVNLHYLRYSSMFIIKNAQTNIYNAKILNQDLIRNAYIPFPPLSQQQQIADFLDRTCAKIDTVIEKTKATIEEYKKLKQSVITEAVTKGIRGDRPMKDSGIEWIGDIPAEWDCLKTKYLFQVGDGSLKIGPFGSALSGNTLEEGPYKIYNQAHLVSNDFSLNRHFVSESTFEALKSYEVKPGDVLFSMMGTIGKCRIMPSGYCKGIMDSHLLKARLNELVDEKYFSYVYDKDHSSIGIGQLNYYSNGSIMSGLNSTIVKNIHMPLPSLEEQKEIADFLDRKCAEIDKLIADKTHLLEEMESYKKSVIYEYVTGKKEVE